jgi:hypothetical protein
MIDSLRCPFCVATVLETDLEWRCPPGCMSPGQPRPLRTDGGPRLIQTLLEQSYPCPVLQCRVIHTWPFIRGCDRPFPLIPSSGTSADHQVAILALDRAAATTATAATALMRSWARYGGNQDAIVPLTFASRRVVEAARFYPGGAIGAAAGASMATERTGSLGRLLLRDIRFDPDDRLEGFFQVGTCVRSKQSVADLVSSMDMICLALSSDSALEPASRHMVEARIAEVGRVLARQPEQSVLPPRLLVLVVDEQRLGARMGVETLPGMQSPEVVDGYVLDGLRLREVLERHLPSDRIRGRVCASLYCTSEGRDGDLAGVRPWLASLP